MGVNDWSLIEAISVWGYGQFVWIPVAVSAQCPFALQVILTNILATLLGPLRHPSPARSMDFGRYRLLCLWILPGCQRISSAGKCE